MRKQNLSKIKPIKHIKKISLYELEGDLQTAITQLQSELNHYSATYKDLIIEVDIEYGRGCSCCSSSDTWSFELKGRPK